MVSIEKKLEKYEVNTASDRPCSKDSKESDQTGASKGKPMYEITSPKPGLKRDGFGMQKERERERVCVCMSEDGRGLAAGSPIRVRN